MRLQCGEQEAVYNWALVQANIGHPFAGLDEDFNQDGLGSSDSLKVLNKFRKLPFFQRT